VFRIEPAYWDIWGQHHVVPAGSRQAVLRSLGLDASSKESLDAALEQQLWTSWNSLLEPVAVLGVENAEPYLKLRLAAEVPATATVSVALYREDGKAERRDFNLLALHETLRIELRGRVFVERSLRLPAPLVMGYHDVEVAVSAPGLPEQRGALRLIAAPATAYLPAPLNADGRAAGLAVSLYGLRSARNWGAGDFTDLKALVDWVAGSLGAAFVALNPLHALANRQPYNISPYLPATVFYRNWLYLDVEAVADFAHCPAAQKIVASEHFQAELKRLRESEYVEYERVARLKLGILRLLFRNFMRQGATNPGELRAFRAWCAEEGDLLERWAIYCALDETIHKRDRNIWIWPDWPEEFRDPASPAVTGFAREHRRLVLFHKYLQWQINLQLESAQARAVERGMPIGLYHDLALATDRCGGDLWAHSELFVSGCRVGSPPDDFAPEGQDWAFPPPNAEAHRADGYRVFVESIRKNSRDGGALRIDHVMRFFRLFWIPDGETAAHGTYVLERYKELLRILALESWRGKFLIVGEDLGTVPPELREAMERFRILSYRLFYFEKGEGGRIKAPEEYPLHALVSSTTHDLPTIAGFWAGRDIELRLETGMLTPDQAAQQREARVRDKQAMVAALKKGGFLNQVYPDESARWTELTGELHNAVIGFLVSTPSQLMVLNHEDLTKELDQQNLPGTTWQYPNWRRKMRLTIEELQTSPQAADFARMFRNWLVRTGRLSVSS
jgi:4-alpha-glucanotransferase